MRLLLMLVAALAGPLPAAAGAFSDLVMAPGLFASDEAGPVLRYEEVRPAGAGAAPAEAGRLTLARVTEAEGTRLALTRQSDGAEEPVASFPDGSPNPVLLYFLESTLRDMAEATGGSPFYIRNRMREALGAADLGAAADGTVTLTPFAGDRNRARMGAFADLALRFRFDPAMPERIVELSADTSDGADGYHHRLTLVPED